MAMVPINTTLTPPLISLCIANYNGIAVLEDCISSILHQNIDIPIEIIIHDDASTDNSVAWLKEHYPEIDLLISAENVGFCVSNNRMVSHARGEFILLLNNDAALYSDALQTLLDAFYSQKYSILTLPQYDWVTGHLVDRGCLLDLFYNPIPNENPLHTNIAMTIGACMFMPRKLWNDLGGFPDWFGSLAEDLYLCCIARIKGHNIGVTQNSGYRHRQGISFGGNRVNSGKLQSTYRRRALSERNKTATLLICTPSLIAWPLLITHCAMLLIEGLLLTIIKNDATLWRLVYINTLKELKTNFSLWYKTRQLIQNNRKISTFSYLKWFSLIPRKLTLLKKYGIPDVK